LTVSLNLNDLVSVQANRVPVHIRDLYTFPTFRHFNDVVLKVMRIIPGHAKPLYVDDDDNDDDVFNPFAGDWVPNGRRRRLAARPT